MAAAIAASLPAPQASSGPAAPSHEAIPASMAKLIDVETEIPLTTVQLDGMVRPYSNSVFWSTINLPRTGCLQNHPA